MNHQTNPICDLCGERVERFKDLKVLKIDGKKTFLCKNCARERRLKHRQETIKESGIENELKELDRIMHNESQRKIYRLRNPERTVQTNTWIPKRYQIQSESNGVQESNSPIKIKGSNISKPKTKTESYITMQEQQIMLREFMSRGYSFEEAKEKIRKLKIQLKDTRDKLKDTKNSEEDFKVSKNKLLEGLR